MKTTTIVAVIGVLALLLIAACQPVTVQQQPPAPEKKQVTVSSTSELTEKADKVQIYLGVETTAPDAATSQRNNAQIADAIVTAIKAAGLSDTEISTAGFNVYPRQEWDPKTQTSVLKGYTTSNTVQIDTTKIELAGAILDAAAKAGANQVNSVQFSLSKDKQDALKKQALGKAAADAKSKAEAIAEGLGAKLGSLASVSESNTYFPPIYARGFESMMALKADAAPAALPPISASDVSVTATISVVYNIE